MERSTDVPRAPAGVDFLQLLAAAVADELEARLPDVLGRPKELWTAEELAERYKLSPASVRRRIQAGEFGPVIRAGGRTKLVTLEGLRAYEAAHTGPAYTPPEAAPAARRHKKSRENPGRI